MQPIKYFYPRVVQIMPCENMWFRYAYKDDDIFFYCRVHCMAIVEFQDKQGNIITEVNYIDADSLGIFDEQPNFESVFYCKFDLSDLTHSLSDERHPLEIIKSLGLELKE